MEKDVLMDPRRDKETRNPQSSREIKNCALLMTAHESNQYVPPKKRRVTELNGMSVI